MLQERGFLCNICAFVHDSWLAGGIFCDGLFVVELWLAWARIYGHCCGKSVLWRARSSPKDFVRSILAVVENVPLVTKRSP